MSTEEYKAGHPLHNKSLDDFTDLFGSVELILRIFNFDFSLKCWFYVINSKTFVTKMRISCHLLPIASGRYEKIPRVIAPFVIDPKLVMNSTIC